MRFPAILFATLLLAAPAFAQTAGPAAPAPATTPAPAPAPVSQTSRMKTCNADAKTQGLKGPDRKTFMSSCLKGEASAAPAPTTAAATTTPATTTPATAKPAARQPSPAQTAERDRMKQCGTEWKTEKAAGKIPAGQTWPKYWSACNTRMKGG